MSRDRTRYPQPYPWAAVDSVEQLEDLLSEPTDAVCATLARLDGDLIFLGVGGKMGPTLARMAKRADQANGSRPGRRILGVSRFSTPGERERMEAHGVETVVCDLLDPEQVDRLPDVPNVVFMTGMKFGSSADSASAARTWAMNSYLPGRVSEKYRHSRLVAFSTGNVYGMSPVHLGGSLESDTLRPQGEYAQSCLGRERLFEHFSRRYNIATAILRLNYAAELRYGVLVDVARKVHAGEPVGLAMGHFNALWQGDANAMALCAFGHVACPPFVVNLAGPELLSVRRVAEEFGRLLGRPVHFEASELGVSADAFLSNGQLGHRLFGYPRVGPSQMMAWVADWMSRGMPALDRPTHFEIRDGNF
jgi:nucleoside-diphosphate-sugar epimerase